MIICPWKELPRYAPAIAGLEEAIALVNSLQTMESAVYPLSSGGRVVVQSGTTRSTEGAFGEAHRKFLDIQYIVDGQEVMGWAPIENVALQGEFDVEKDIGAYAGNWEFIRIAAGHCYVVFPEDAHLPSAHLEEPNTFCKIVVKLPV